MLQINDLTVRVAGRVLIDKASVALPPNARVGFLGRNGTGKTTLFKVITGDYGADEGTVKLPARAKIGGVAQEAPGGPETLIDFVLKADKERAALLAEAETATDPNRIAEVQTRLADIDAHSAPARAAIILAGLGFDAEAQARPCSDFSGGWRMRVALAAVLFAEPDLLLLDEPTNYLDLEGTLWLQQYLATYPHSILLISHDRDLLDASVDFILHLDQRKLTLWRGSYSTFAKSRAIEIAVREKAVRKQEDKRADLQAFVDRFRAKASKARQAQSRLKMLEKMDTVTAIVETDVPPFIIPPPERKASPPIINLEGASVGYEPGKPILTQLSLRIDDDDRIGLLGSNGNGKSTFLKLISDRLKPMGGRVVRAEKMKIAYFAQHQLDELRPQESVYQHMRRLMPDAPEAKVRSAAARTGFSSDRADTKVASLSGGEKARLLFALAVAEGPHLLILDEPTNHLDIDSRAALVDALNGYPGAVMIVSHDRHLLEATVDRLWLVNDGTVKPFDGDLDDYRKIVLSGPASPNAKPGKGTGKAAEKAEASAAAEAVSAAKPAAPRLDAKGLARRIGEIEAQMAKLKAEIDKIDRILAQPGYFQAHPNNATEATRIRAVKADQLASAEEEWLAVSEELEAVG
ncbi:ABC-F family ATP-binding cassette domain-containing protein [Phreatobacter aquaticus]|uniref:ABC-F family ATP-binding cassette domain-containing protein n=1 Tax=Phreatobacter aquaticus TaxID=2570229 RepID=A0A4D7QJ11_9HYPH|nr:ABC-F family ATP-binding cassette domain-containing protein [Phreatobacter aquaticus]QCK87025.1 ABC-F family ATP-binding cassette domain-containing protein [Phreatobacter aquaticus]